MLASQPATPEACPPEASPSDSSSPPLLSLAVDALRQALLVFDELGHVVGANAAARRLIDQSLEVELVASREPPHDRVRLHVRRTALQLRLERALRGAVAAGVSVPALRGLRASGAPRPAQAVVLADQGGQPSLILQLTPLDASMAQAGNSSAALLGVLIDRLSTPTLETRMLRELFGMTDAEARVSEAYLRVDTVKDVAQLLGVSVNTVKTHLAAAYLKTGCTRQAQFVRLLMALSELGEQGAQAMPGVNGASGINGSNGINGAHGANGTRGANGANGTYGERFAF